MSLKIWRGEEDQRARLETLSGAADQAATAWLRSPPVLDGQRTVAEQALAVAAEHGLDEPPDLADFVVDLLDADALLDKPTWHFSRGEQQMAGLVLTFARPFERLILINPTAGLDPGRSRALADFLADLAQDIEIHVASNAEVFGLF